MKIIEVLSQNKVKKFKVKTPFEKCPVCFNTKIQSNRYKDLETVRYLYSDNIVTKSISRPFELNVYCCEYCNDYFTSIY